MAPTRSNWIVLFSAWFLALSGSIYLILPAGVLTSLMGQLAIGAVAAGWIVSLPYAGEAVFGIPSGTVLDRRDNRTMMVVAVTGLFVANVWGWAAGVTDSYHSLLASRFLGGAAFVLLWIAGINVVSAVFSGRWEATAVGLYTTSGPAGLAIGLLIGPPVFGVFGWAGKTIAVSSVLLLSLACFLIVTREIVIRTNRNQTPSWDDFWRVLTDRGVCTVALLCFCGYSLFLLLSGWMPTYLTEVHGLSLEESGFFVALFPAVGILSRSGGGIISDRLLDQRRRPVALITFAVSTPILLAIGFAADIRLVITLLIVAGFSIQLGFGVFFTYGRELVSDDLGGTAVAFLTTTGIFGSFVSPLIAGALIDQFDSYAPMFGYAVVLGLIGIILAIAAPQSTTRDR